MVTPLGPWHLLRAVLQVFPLGQHLPGPISSSSGLQQTLFRQVVPEVQQRPVGFMVDEDQVKPVEHLLTHLF